MNKKTIISFIVLVFMIINSIPIAAVEDNSVNSISENYCPEDYSFEYNPYNDEGYLNFFDIDRTETSEAEQTETSEERESQRSITDNDVYLSASSIDIVHGGTANISCIYPSGATVSYMYWLSTSPQIATINQNGVITGVGYGECSVYVMTEINGVFYQLYCSVYVYLSDGVYYIKNEYSNKYLEVKNGDISQYTRIQQYDKRTLTNEQLRQMWKIHYLGSKTYSIRPMSMPVMPMTAYTFYGGMFSPILYRNTANDSYNTLNDNEKWEFSFDYNNNVISAAIKNRIKQFQIIISRYRLIQTERFL